MCLWLWLSMAFGAPSAGWRVGRRLVCDCKVTKYCRNNCVPGGLICKSPAGCGVFLLMVLGRLPPCRTGAALTLPPRGGLHHCLPFARRMPFFIFVKCFSNTLIDYHSSCRPPCFDLALLAFANGSGQSVCQWRRFVLPPGGSLGFGGCSPAPRPAWSGLPLMWLRLMKMYGFCQCRHWPWLSARAAVVWVMCRFAV